MEPKLDVPITNKSIEDEQTVVSVHQVNFQEWIPVRDALEEEGFERQQAMKLVEIQRQAGYKPADTMAWINYYRHERKAERVLSGPLAK